jgi:hypothetical protein
MPLEKDPGHGGTEKDGTKSSMYCSYCYEDGALHPMTLDEMKVIVENAMKKEGMNWFMRKMAMWQLPHLKRWKNPSS